MTRWLQRVLPMVGLAFTVACGAVSNDPAADPASVSASSDSASESASNVASAQQAAQACPYFIPYCPPTCQLDESCPAQCHCPDENAGFTECGGQRCEKGEYCCVGGPVTPEGPTYSCLKEGEVCPL